MRDFVHWDWQNQILRCNSKIEHLSNKYNKKVPPEPDLKLLKKDVLINDKDIKEWEKKESLQQTENYITYGDPNLDDDERSYLRQPADHRLLDQFNRDFIENKAEKIATKMRFENMRTNNLNPTEEGDNYDQHWEGEGLLDFRKMKVTNFKTNGRIYTPKIGTKEEELIIERTKDEYIRITSQYLSTETDKPENITDQQWAGLKKLKKRVKNKELVITSTDKSKKTAVMTTDMYNKCTESHTKIDKKTNWKMIKKIERQANY